MFALEQLIIAILLAFTDPSAINAFLSDPQTTAILIGGLIATAGALLGTFLLLRGMALVSDAISHTVLLGIVVAFLVLAALPGQAADLSSPWLILGAAAAGVATVVLTEFIERSGLVRQDAALGLVFPLLFAIAVILVSRYVDDIHIDTDAVMVGEIGLAWANTNSHCMDNCEAVVITPEHPAATLANQCVNCRDLGISPRDEGAEFRQICTNCGTYSPAQAWQSGLTSAEPLLVFWPRAITVMLVLTVLTLVFVLLFYKELKLTTFDAGLAQALGFRPGALNLALMVLVSLVAVGAFDAVGSILVIAFFIIPPAAAYLLTDRLWLMLVLSPVIGTLGTIWGYDLARGFLPGGLALSDVLAGLNRTFGLSLQEQWNSSISASMVLMIFFLFLLAWLFSPSHGLIATMIRRASQRATFHTQVVLGHIYNHQHTSAQASELAVVTLHEHFHWSPNRMRRILAILRLRNLVEVADQMVVLTPRGEAEIRLFRQHSLGRLPGE